MSLVRYYLEICYAYVSAIRDRYLNSMLVHIVIEHFPQPDVKLDYVGDAAGTYCGFDRFGRENSLTHGTGDGI